MLELKKITKSYKTGDFIQNALKGVSIDFRENEFVSILGPSGSGKTTLLNIIGGLDKCSSGDLVINGKSTKEYNDRDWDAYRNHSIGFVFQSYNLIQHQSILANVELALTLSGISKSERRKKAKKALEKVGLKKHINKRPNQLSGGQMQRVAIARALVNDPDILLADEPTGALDSNTSTQIMEMLKEVAKDRLVIMVTHNAELAQKYSTRIIELKDGAIKGDTNKFDGKKDKTDKKEESKINSKKTSMSFFTALALSLNNLMTKKGRTMLTAFAGSIGIIGIALILALSNGVQEYIDRTQEETLSSYPLSIEEKTIDSSAMIELMMGQNKSDVENQEEGNIYSNNIMNEMMSTMSSKIEENNLKKFKEYLENNISQIKESLTAVEYDYNLNLNIYAQKEDKIYKTNPSPVFEKLGFSMGETQSAMMASISSTDVFLKQLDNEELVHSQYDLLAGTWPQKYNEVVLLVDENNQISDYTLYSLGLKDQDELEERIETIMQGSKIEEDEQVSYTYDQILNLEFKILPQTDYYEKEGSIWVDKSEDEEYIKEKLSTAETLKVVGIIKISEDAVASQTAGVVLYTKELEEYIIDKISKSEIVKEQLENENINVLTGFEFNEEKTSSSFDMNSLTDEQRAYLMSLSQEELANVISAYTENANATFESTLEKIGYVKLDEPSTIKIYPKDFEAKDNIELFISDYNTKMEEEGNEEDTINYTDTVGIIMASVTSIINVISYVLIAFVSISLVVSSIMIGIITYISVLERTKEIGILRALGARKKDITRVFNAETFIIGIFSGSIGILVTILLIIPTNLIIENLTELSNVAVLNPVHAIILIIISVILTLIGGFIPAKIASRKDPVEALRTE